ncbi:hypothetical protein ID866_6858 [Astraeus odoratus]|nr:hypothetical protein ID866_6858 [Astraeus odoratus]
MSPSMPTILVQSSPAPDAERNSASPDAAENANDQRRITSRRDHAHGDQRDVQGQEVCDDHEGHNRAGGPGGETRPQAFFAGEEDLQLAGVGVFSPAVSQPPSPELPRVKLNTWEGGVFSVNEAEERTADTVSLRRRVQQPQEQLE